jgi:hypothetical protein
MGPMRNRGKWGNRWGVPAALLLAACGSGDDGGACPAPDAALERDCASGACPALAVAGDGPAANPGTFKGFADPSAMADPATGTIWLGYSWPHVVAGQDPNGNAVQMAAVQNRLARSDNGGASFSYVQVLWPDVAAADPEGSGENGRISSETASLAHRTVNGVTTWYGAHLRYFLRPITGYNPRYGTSWQVRIGAAPTPQGLATATEAVLGVTNTAGAYQPDERLDQLAGQRVQDCAMLNNPTLFVQDQTLYLVVECLAFNGTHPNYDATTMQVFATDATGSPPNWAWRYAGELADHGLAVELGSDTILQPDVSLGADGAPVLLLTPAHIDTSTVTGTVGDGCVALELASIDPPALARDCDGNLKVRARITGSGIGACTHERLSSTGIIPVTQGPGGGNWSTRDSDLHP